MYILAKLSSTHGYQINRESRFCRRIVRGSIVKKEIEQSDFGKFVDSNTQDVNELFEWYWEDDDANRNVWNKYEHETCYLVNSQTEKNFGSNIPYRRPNALRNVNYHLIRCSLTEGIQRNYNTGFSRRIVRSDHPLIVNNVQNIQTSQQYQAKLKEELYEKRIAPKQEEIKDDENEEKYESVEE